MNGVARLLSVAVCASIALAPSPWCGQQTVAEPNGSEGRTATWQEGAEHPGFENVVAAADPGRWVPAPGHRFVSPGSGDLLVQWVAGTPHPERPDLAAAACRDHWIPVRGRTWREPASANDFDTVPAFHGTPVTGDHVVFVLDVSKSMEAALVDLKSHVHDALREFEGRSFNMVAFCDNVIVWRPRGSKEFASMQAAIDSAIAFVDTLDVCEVGASELAPGTDIEGVIRTVFALQDRPADILLLSDGQVSTRTGEDDEQRVVDSARRRNSGVGAHFKCIAWRQHSALLEALSRLTPGGSYRVVGTP